jgi:glycosyltransferase involved in cell wall biosynthesis
MRKLVSILTPCYNGEKHIWRLLDSVLKQTYPRIEMFVIDDGSTDNSPSIIKSYIPRFEDKGYSLTYVYQENQGLASTINNGLKFINGDYLLYPDADDYYQEENAVRDMADALDKSDETVSIARGKCYVRDDEALDVIDKFDGDNEFLFEDCLWYKNRFYHFCIMLKVPLLDKLIPHREIFTSKWGGQNWQILLPLLYKHRCITLDKYLFNVLANKESLSRKVWQEHLIENYMDLSRTQLETIDNLITMPVEEKEKYKRLIEKAFRKNIFRVRMVIFLKKIHLYSLLKLSINQCFHK